MEVSVIITLFLKIESSSCVLILPVDVEDIVNKISYVYKNAEQNVKDNQESLKRYTIYTIKFWNENIR
jgi:hypothetical protein